MSKKIGLIILDGFGINEKVENNAIKKADTPVFKELFTNNYTKLEASEKYVGLPEGQMGNSEVGHLTIGSGRVLKQLLVEINDLFKTGDFEKIEEFQKGINHCRKNNSKLHLFTLFGSGGVHAYIDQLVGMIKIIPQDIKVCLHLFSDGRDLAKDSFLAEFETFSDFLNDYKNIEITTVSGRFYSMDRDNNWDRIKKIYDEMVKPTNIQNISIKEHIKNNYKNEIFDEFFKPTNFTGSIIESGDTIFHLNFRSDRATQLTKAFFDINDDYFERINIKNLFIVTMTKFYKEYDGNIFIKSGKIKNTLGKVLSNNNLTQLHLAETEKFAHVTKFFNGGKQIIYPLEKDILIPSPKVETYDLKPEMSAYEIFETYIENFKDFDFTVINFANPDMVGHTGNMNAAIKSVEILDEIVGKLLKLSKENDIDLYISSDHGNCELMFDENGEIVTSHTTNQVPLWYIKKGNFCELKHKYGTLADIAPTILNNFGIYVPEDITGKNLN